MSQFKSLILKALVVAVVTAQCAFAAAPPGNASKFNSQSTTNTRYY